MNAAAHSPTAHVSMLVRRPVGDVFAAVVDPEQIVRFWIGSTTGPLGPDASVHWEFKVPGSKVDVTVTRFEPDRTIELDWSDGTTVTWSFREHDSGSTVVEVENTGFAGDPDEATQAALGATQGFTIVVCDLKTLVESGTSAQLSRDKAVLIESEQPAD